MGLHMPGGAPTCLEDLWEGFAEMLQAPAGGDPAFRCLATLNGQEGCGRPGRAAQCLCLKLLRRKRLQSDMH